MELAKKIWNSFRGGRYTRSNIADISDDHVLVAKNVIFPGDGIAHKCPGYTLVKASGIAWRRIFDFQRQSDGQQFVLLSGGGKLSWMRTDGSALTQLSGAEDANSLFDFVQGVFEAYASNGKVSYVLEDRAGVLTEVPWGYGAPATAPTITLIAGTLTLTKGRQYAFSYVEKWTDSQGVQRVHVGAPSPISAHTGAFNSQAVQLNGLVASASPFVTHIWIWSTNDTAFNTTSTLFFAAEIVNGVTSFGDSQADTALDTTRVIPYDNQPAPLAKKLLQFQQRVVAIGIPGKPDLVQASGLEETPLGIPQRSFPLSVFFNVPGGIKELISGCVFNEALMLATSQFWFQITGISASTFAEHDNIFEPGAAGLDCVVTTQGWMVWLGVDKKIWAWNGVGEPVEVSWKIARADGSTQLSMESLSDAVLANSQLKFLSFGKYNIIALFCSTTANTNFFDWCQMWDVTALTGPAGPFGEMTKDGRLMMAAESDRFFTDTIYAAANVLVGNTKYLFLADLAGNIYRWPDGFTDNGQLYTPVIGTEYSDCDEPDISKRFFWTDVKTNRTDAANSYGIAAQVADGLNPDIKPIALQVIPRPSKGGDGPDPTIARGKMNQRGTSTGKLVRAFVIFPRDDKDSELYEIVVNSQPLGGE